MEKVKLNNGIEMPKVGIGTFMLTPDQTEEYVYNALKNGYSTDAYVNERGVSRGIKRSGIAIEEIFLKTKLWSAFYEEENKYEIMEKAVKEGKVRAVGLSNFDEEKIQEIWENFEVKLALLQTEAHPYYPQTDMKNFLSKYDMKIQAWYPLGHGDKGLINEKIFTKLGEKYGKSNVQIILRWHIQSDNIVIPGATNPDHIKANIDIFDFELTDEEMQEISKINKNKRYYEGTPELLQSYVAMKPDLDAQK